MSLIDRLWGTIFNPDTTLRQLVAEKPLGQGIILYITVLIIIMIINQGVDALRPIEEALNLPAQFIWLLGSIGIIFSLFILLLSAGFLSLLSEIIYKRGNSLGLLVGLCFAALPGVFGPLLQYGSALLGLNWLGVIFSIITLVWVVILQIIAIRAALSLNTGQAMVIYFLPLLIFAITAIAVTSLILVSSLPALI